MGRHYALRGSVSCEASPRQSGHSWTLRCYGGSADARYFHLDIDFLLITINGCQNCVLQWSAADRDHGQCSGWSVFPHSALLHCWWWWWDAKLAASHRAQPLLSPSWASPPGYHCDGATTVRWEYWEKMLRNIFWKTWGAQYLCKLPPLVRGAVNSVDSVNDPAYVALLSGFLSNA